MSEPDEPTLWIDGRVQDEAPTPVAPWQQIVSVLVLLLLFDLVLGLRSDPPERDHEPAQIRETLARVDAAAEAGRRAILMIGDSALGDAMRRELGRESDAAIEEVAFDGLLPIDALHLAAALDRLDPVGEVELVVELSLRDFAPQYAERRDCTRPEICELGDARVDLRERLLAWTPVHRRREHVGARSLDQLPGLAVARGEPDGASPAQDDLDSAVIDPSHAQVEALVGLLERAAANGRKLTLFLPPLADGLARRSFTDAELGRRYAALAGLVNDYEDPDLALLDLDHPLFVDAHFVDDARLGVEGERLLALNLLHELALPLEHRPFEAQMVHPEGFDRTLVHRVELGYADGGAALARFDHPEGVAVSRDGARIVVADTHNHVLRELRGTMQIVETLVGRPDAPGHADGPARAASLDHPRSPELLGDAVWFIDGEQRDAIRVLERGFVRTPRLEGETCEAYTSIRARPGAIWALCSDSRLIFIDPATRTTERVSDVALSELVAFDLGRDTIYLADVDGRLWRRGLAWVDGRPQLGAWDNFFANTADSPLPHGHRVGYPYGYDELRLTKVAELRYVERYAGLLIADELPLVNSSERLEQEWTERVQLRYFDLGGERILPWVKAVPHGEAHALYNGVVDQVASYWHLGAMAIAQDDASLVWVERRRSRLLHVADGLLGVAKSGNHHTRMITIPMLQTLAAASRTVEAQLRPDRYLSRRFEPLARKGPYVALILGSSLSSMSDRLSNYSLGRRLELELQRELGYRDLIRLDLFQVSGAASSFADNVNAFGNWMETSVPPDVVFIEAHDFGGGEHYLRGTEGREQVVEAFRRLRRLADRYDTLVVFYDLSSIEANRRDGMRSTDKQTRELLDEAARLGFVVLDPGDRLLRELLRHSPWGNQPFDNNQHHGAPWAVDLTARTLAAMVYPKLKAFFRDRVPARERERDPVELGRKRRGKPLGPALAELDLRKLARVDPTYVQTELVDAELRVYVDLAGFRETSTDDLDALAVAVIAKVLREDVYADFAELLRLELVEFGSYDEYGNGVLESARSRWRRVLDRRGLEAFLREHGPR